MYYKYISTTVFFLFLALCSFSQITLEKEVKITDFGLHFNGSKVTSGTKFNSDDGNINSYDYYFGRNISAHGDCIKTYENYVFMTWYRGGEDDRHVMLTRYNTITGTSVDIEFPHRHTGFQNKPWIGESHNTIAVAISPIDGTIHLLYDMHAYSRTRPSDGSLGKDYFRYSYSVKDAASASDAEFTLEKFVKNTDGGYKHLSLNGGEDYANFAALTYPQFFMNDAGDLFMYMREGGNNNGAYKFSKYNANTTTWSAFTDFNVLNAKRQAGITHNWGLYGNMKYVNGKIRVGFQRRSANNNDKYQYQNGVYYAYSDNQNGFSDWKNHSGEAFTLPLFDADFAKVMEPGDYVRTTQKSKVHIVGNFDWTVTENGDVHIISRVKDNQYNETKYLHTYKPAGANDFITSEDFAGGSSIYTSGEDVFIIGLKNNRVFVQKAEGGTNNFKTVYQATSGRTFDHGRVFIANDKLYYYLMEKKTGTAQPLYLQIIDLDIQREPFRISLTSPFDSENFILGQDIKIAANAINENGSINKVEFVVNGDYLDDVTSKPYAVNWTPTVEGTYAIKAIAYNDDNETVSSTEITVSVNPFNPTDLTGTTYRLKNVATGKYLKSQGSDIVTSNTSDTEDTYWQFLKSPSDGFFNIDSKVRGTLRVTSVGQLISSVKDDANSDPDKIWQVIYHESDKTYSFIAGESGRYLSVNASEMGVSTELDNESKWAVTPINVLSVYENLNDLTSVEVYPNPTKNNFTLSFQGITKATVKIYNILGKVVFEKVSLENSMVVNNDNLLKSGVYLVRVIADGKKVINKKLIVE